MGYKNENLKHANGIQGKPKYSCPCGKGLNIPKLVAIVSCKCGKIIDKEDIVIN